MTSATTSARYTGGACCRVEGDAIDEDCWIARIPFDEKKPAHLYKIHHSCYPGRKIPQTNEFKKGLAQSGICTVANLPHQFRTEYEGIDKLSTRERRSFDYAEQQVILYIQKKSD